MGLRVARAPLPLVPDQTEDELRASTCVKECGTLPHCAAISGIEGSTNEFVIPIGQIPARFHLMARECPA